MSDEEYRLLIKALGGQIFEDNENVNSVVKNLIQDTIHFRDKLKEETGQILTVEDTRKALDALETHLNGEKFPSDLTPEQKALAQIFIDRIKTLCYPFDIGAGGLQADGMGNQKFMCIPLLFTQKGSELHPFF